MPKVRSLLLTLRLYGIAGARRLLANNLYSTTHCFRLHLDLRGWQSNGHPGVSGPVKVRRGRLEELRRWRETVKLPPDFFEDLTHELQWFYLGFWNEEIAHIQWIADGERPCTVSNLVLQPGEVEIRNVHTLAKFRRKHLYSHVVAFAINDLQSSGIKTIYAHVNTGNKASLNGFLAAGFRSIERITTRRVLGVDWIKHEILQGSAQRM